MRLRVAACQMEGKLGDVAENLARAESLAEEGFDKGARWVILPEFFPSAVAYHEVMHQAAMPVEGPALAMMRGLARRRNGFVGGSFITIKGRDRFNTFVLVRPDGTFAMHDKDQPTMWENCYYTFGADDGVLEADGQRVGAALCWELIRWRTVRRLRDRIDLLVAATCWAGGPRNWPLRLILRSLEEPSRRILRDTLPRVAKLLGVPVVHASQVGNFRCPLPILPGHYDSHFLGETQIVDREGVILARLAHEDGPGVISAEIETGPVTPKEMISPDAFWIPDLPAMVRAVWWFLNRHGVAYYARMKRLGVY